MVMRLLVVLCVLWCPLAASGDGAGHVKPEVKAEKKPEAKAEIRVEKKADTKAGSKPVSHSDASDGEDVSDRSGAFEHDDVTNPRVRIETRLGDIVIELYPKLAPRTVANFLGYVDSKYYDGTIFDRVVKDVCIYGGRYDANLETKKDGLRDPIEYEAVTALKHVRGVVGQARRLRAHTGQSQFFINMSENPRFDFKKLTPAFTGYTPFGRVVAGWDVVEKIHSEKCFAHPNQQLGPRKRAENPVETVLILSVRRVKRVVE